MRDPVMIQANMENNAERFWDNIREKFPEVAKQMSEKNWAVVDGPVWDKIKDLPGFFPEGGGPYDAALEVASDFNIADRCREYVLELQDWEDTNGFSTVDLVKQCFNAKKAEIDEHGDICIGDERSMAWLDHKRLFEFMVWHMEQVK